MNPCLTLWDAAVLELWLYDLYGVILWVKVNLTLSDSVCLSLSLRHSFLEVSIEAQSLKEKREEDKQLG